MTCGRVFGAAVALMALAVPAAHAEPRAILKPYAIDARPQALDPVNAKPRLASAYAQTNALRAAGIARTSVDRRFDGDEAVGSVAFLCGIQPSRDFGGASSAYGSDPHGRFLGAKLSRAF